MRLTQIFEIDLEELNPFHDLSEQSSSVVYESRRNMIVAMDFLDPTVSEQQLVVLFCVKDLATQFDIPFLSSNSAQYFANGRQGDSIVHDIAAPEWMTEQSLVYLIAPDLSTLLPTIKDLGRMGCEMVVLTDAFTNEPSFDFKPRIKEWGFELRFLDVKELSIFLSADSDHRAST